MIEEEMNTSLKEVEELGGILEEELEAGACNLSIKLLWNVSTVIGLVTINMSVLV
jgi:hypothetical protein